MHVVLKFRMGMQVPAPAGDFGVQVGNAVDDRHRKRPLLAVPPAECRQCSKQSPETTVRLPDWCRAIKRETMRPAPSFRPKRRPEDARLEMLEAFQYAVARRARSSVGRARDF